MPAKAPAHVRRLSARSGQLPPRVAPGGTRGAVLDAALRLFAEYGFAGASIRDIATGAGIQSATLYAHYPSKEHILADLIRIGHEEHHRRLRSALLESQPDPRKQLTAFVRAHVRMHADHSMLAVVANAELHALSEKLGAPAFTLRQQSVELLQDIVRRGVELGIFETPDVFLAVAAIGAMGMRVAHWFTPEFERSADEVAEIYATFALRVLGAAPNARS